MLNRNLVLSVVLLLGAPAGAQVAGIPSPPVAPEVDPLDTFVAVLRRQVPLDFGDGIMLIEARREGNAGILVMDVPAEYFGVLTPRESAGHVARGFCRGERAARFFERGYRLRVDLRTGDRVTRGEEISRCPG